MSDDADPSPQTDSGASPPPRTFIMENSLFRLCRHLRLMGYDCLCGPTFNHDTILQRAAADGRILVVCSPKLLDRLKCRGAKELVSGEPHIVDHSLAANNNNNKEKGISLTSGAVKRPKVVEVYSSSSSSCDGCDGSDGDDDVVVATTERKIVPTHPRKHNNYNDDDDDDDDGLMNDDDEDADFWAEVQLGVEDGEEEGLVHPPPPPQTKKKSNKKNKQKSNNNSNATTTAVLPRPISTISFLHVNHQVPFRQQMEHLVDVLDLANATDKRVFSRCLKCGVQIVDVEKVKVKDRVHANVYILYARFYECPSCNKVYWGVDGAGDGSGADSMEVLNYKSMRSLNFLTSYGVDAKTMSPPTGTTKTKTAAAGASTSPHFHLFRVIPLHLKLRALMFLRPSDIVALSLCSWSSYDLTNIDYLWCWYCRDCPERHNLKPTTLRPSSYTLDDILKPCAWRLRYKEKVLREKKEKEEAL
eukprot:PhM_4_TR12732/c0_g1_i1/m.105981